MFYMGIFSQHFRGSKSGSEYAGVLFVCRSKSKKFSEQAATMVALIVNGVDLPFARTQENET